MTALAVYKDATTHACVVQAVQEALKMDGGASFGRLNTRARQQARENLTDKLIQIAMDNRLCKFQEYAVKDNLLSHCKQPRSPCRGSWKLLKGWTRAS